MTPYKTCFLGFVRGCFLWCFCSSISTVFICQNSCSVFYKKGGRAGLCLLLLYEIITVLCILFTAAHFYNHYCNVCVVVFFYKHALPFSALPRKLPLHIRRHRLSRYFPDFPDPKRLNFAAVQECVQCIFSNAEKLHDLLKLHDLIFHVTGLLSAFSRIFLLFLSLC